MTKYYTGIGSRNTPEHVQKLMQALAHKLAYRGWVLRSGGADGADTAFESGVLHPQMMEIYLPWSGFNSRFETWYINAGRLPLVKQAEKIASEIHPNWNACSAGARKLHTRNVNQVLGRDLNTPSKFVICYAEPTKDGGVKGGTGTAVKLALQHSIPVYNLWYESEQHRFMEWVNNDD